MKLKYQCEIAEIGDEFAAVPIGCDEFNGMLRLNETSADVLKLLRDETSEDEIVAEMLKMYNASEEDIRRSVRKVVEHVRSEGLLLET